MFELKKYTYAKLSTIATVKGGDSFPSVLQGNTNENDLPFYKVSDMNTVGNEKKMVISQNYIATDKIGNGINVTVFKEGTIIFPKVGQAIGTNKKRILSRKAAVDNNTMAVTLFSDSVNVEYLYSYFDYEIILSNIASDANPPSMTAGAVEALKVPLPPKTLQDEFALYVSACDKLKFEAQSYQKSLKNECLK